MAVGGPQLVISKQYFAAAGPTQPVCVASLDWRTTTHGGTTKVTTTPVTGPKFERGGVRGRGWHRSYSRSKGQKKAERARALFACFRRTIEI